MLKLKLIGWLPPLVVVISSCATQAPVPPAPPQVVEAGCPRLAPAPAAAMIKQEPNFLTKLQAFFSAKQDEPMPLSGSSPSAKPR